MNSCFTKALSIVALVASAGIAHSATILDQSFDGANPVSGASFNEGSATVFEDFTIGSSTTLGQLTIWGVHWSSGAIPALEDFRADIRADSGGALGASVALSNLTVTSRIDTGVDHNNLSGANILEYTFSFDTDVTLDAGTYWISAFLGTDAPGTTWAWQRTSSTIGNAIGSTGSVAIVLEDAVSPVPLPAGMPLLLAGLGGMVLLRRKKGSKAES